MYAQGEALQGNIKKGLLPSDCREQKAVLAAAVQGEALSLYPWRLSWFLRWSCATSPHPHQSNDASANQCRVCLLFTVLSKGFLGKLTSFSHQDHAWPSCWQHLQFSGRTPPSFYSHTPATLAFSYTDMCSFLNITFITNSICRSSKIFTVETVPTAARQC